MNKKVVFGARTILGLIFLVFGLNGLLMILTGTGFIPMPAPSEKMMAVMGGLFAAGYLMPLVKVLEIVGGAFLLSNRYVPLALALLAPIMVNILGLHLFAEPSALPMGATMTILMGILFADNRRAFQPLFVSKR